MEENKTKEIIAEQITQNYLLQPQDLFNSQEKASYSFADMSMPEVEAISINNYIFKDDTDINEEIIEQNLTENKTSNTYEKIDFTNVNSIPKESSPIIFKAPSQNLETNKKINTIEQQLISNITPAISNLYKSVSALLNKGKDPKGYTEARPTYAGINLYFNDEKLRVSKTVEW
jgi:hypothetical protein